MPGTPNRSGRLWLDTQDVQGAVFHPPSLALSLARATLLCENKGTQTTLETPATIEPNHAPN